MKTLNDYMEILEDKDEGGVVPYPDLPGRITCGETVENVAANAADAKRAWIDIIDNLVGNYDSVIVFL